MVFLDRTYTVNTFCPWIIFNKLKRLESTAYERVLTAQARNDATLESKCIHSLFFFYLFFLNNDPQGYFSLLTTQLPN